MKKQRSGKCSKNKIYFTFSTLGINLYILACSCFKVISTFCKERVRLLRDAQRHVSQEKRHEGKPTVSFLNSEGILLND